MCRSLNGRAPEVGVDGLKTSLVSQVALFELELAKLLKDEKFSITSDTWTSNANDSYAGVTIHWITKDWKLMSCPLGCDLKEGSATAADHERDVTSITAKFFVLRQSSN